MTVAQNESFPIPTPWMIMKTEDGTNFIHLLTPIVTGLKAAATNPSEVTVSQTHSHHAFKKQQKQAEKQTKQRNLPTAIPPGNPVTGRHSDMAEFAPSTTESISGKMKCVDLLKLFSLFYEIILAMPLKEIMGERRERIWK